MLAAFDFTTRQYDIIFLKESIVKSEFKNS